MTEIILCFCLHRISHFKVVSLVTWPLSESEAEIPFVKFSYKPHCFSFGNRVVLMLTSLHLHMKRIEVSLKTTLFSLLLKWTI